MQRFKRVLLIADEEGLKSQILKRAGLLAAQNGAKLTALQVIDGAPQGFSELGQALQQNLETLVAPLIDQGADVTCKIRFGTPFLEIIREAMENGHDLVLKTASGAHEGYRRLFASVDMHLMRKCPCPVWIMKPGQRYQFERILAAVDPDPSDRERDVLCRIVMDLGTSLAEIDGADLQVLHAWRLKNETSMRGSAMAKIPKAAIDAMVDKQELDSRHRFESLLRDYAGRIAPDHAHAIKGEPPRVIAKFAEDRGSDVIVMGTIARTGIPGLIVGNTAESVLNEVSCSVLAVKPPGFVSPVTLENAGRS